MARPSVWRCEFQQVESEYIRSGGGVMVDRELVLQRNSSRMSKEDALQGEQGRELEEAASGIIFTLVAHALPLVAD